MTFIYHPPTVDSLDIEPSSDGQGVMIGIYNATDNGTYARIEVVNRDVEELIAEIRKAAAQPSQPLNVTVSGTLLAELRKAQDKLARVEKIAASMDRIADFNLSILPHDDMGISLRQHAEDIRAAVADATGGERG